MGANVNEKRKTPRLKKQEQETGAVEDREKQRDKKHNLKEKREWDVWVEKRLTEKAERDTQVKVVSLLCVCFISTLK